MTAPPRPNLRLTLPPVLTRAETAALFGVAPKTLQKPGWDARLRPFRTLGGHRRYHRETVARVREEQTDTAAVQPPAGACADPSCDHGAGTAFPGRPGWVTGECGHAVAGSEWRAGFRSCERCPCKHCPASTS